MAATTAGSVFSGVVGEGRASVSNAGTADDGGNNINSSSVVPLGRHARAHLPPSFAARNTITDYGGGGGRVGAGGGSSSSSSSVAPPSAGLPIEHHGHAHETVAVLATSVHRLAASLAQQRVQLTELHLQNQELLRLVRALVAAAT